MARKYHPADPRGLLAEAYTLDIGIEDCRTIFFDWAVGHSGMTGRAEIRALLEAYGTAHPDHPMTRVLEEGLAAPARAHSRRGGAKARRKP
ncbi:hypothetical protein [Amaricoccus macauensis]|uniref:hypothetical protein n=1 Tax=Amaricoccus macauensis TaxID=57001 RepID=UPI003C7AE027